MRICASGPQLFILHHAEQGAGEDGSSHCQNQPLHGDQAMQKGCRKTGLPLKRPLRGVLEITVSPFSGLPASLSEPPSCPLAGLAAGCSLSAPPGDGSRDRTQDRSHRETATSRQEHERHHLEAVETLPPGEGGRLEGEPRAVSTVQTEIQNGLVRR